MVEQFVGTWKLTSSENFDEYMKAIGVGFATYQMGNVVKPNIVFRARKTIFTFENGKLIQKQTWDGKTT
uniref:Cytosolic fatty-acid binding proteins domain-containing protein n=1 Tax=Neogobius melanostomus TaxID=47308 RepID=A0A8C6U5C1_9GOBI